MSTDPNIPSTRRSFCARTLLWVWGAASSGRWAAWAAESGSSGSAPAYQVKAAFLFNFVKFTTWPAKSFKDAKSPYCLGVVGQNPFDRALQEVVVNETHLGRPFVVEELQPTDDLRHCHLLFFSASVRNSAAELLQKLASEAVLTVGDHDGFLDQGGMIQFFQQDQSIRFAIDPARPEATGLKLSSKLRTLSRSLPRGR